MPFNHSLPNISEPIDFFTWSNDITGGFWQLGILAIVFLIPMLAFKSLGFKTSDSFLVSSLAVFFTSVYMLGAGLVTDVSVNIFASLMVIIGMVLVYVESR